MCMVLLMASNYACSNREMLLFKTCFITVGLTITTDNVYVFARSRIITACAINTPGSMHDSCIAEWYIVYTKLENAF